ncbi:MAG TPA: carbohydrate porin [Chthoniobacterales bacterium]
MRTRTFSPRILPLLVAWFSACACSAGLADEGGFLTRLHSVTEQSGVTFRGEYTGEGLGNLTGGIRRGATYEALIKLGVQLDLKPILGWTGATLSATALYPFGEGLSREYTGDFNILSNIDAYDSFRLFEFWFQQRFFGGNASFRIGQMAADQEFYQSQRSNIFINSCFGTFPTISMGTSLPIYPVGGLGARLDVHPSAGTFARVAVFDSNPGQANGNDRHGTRFNLSPGSGVLVIAEGGWQVVPSSDNGGRDETYTLGAYYDSRRFNGGFVHPAHAGNGGFYAIADRLLYRPTPYVNAQSKLTGLGGFASIAAAPADRNEVSFYADTGLNYNGVFPGRDHDVFGLAVSYTRISRDYLIDRRPIHSGHEAVLEGTYRVQVTDHLYIQPDIQYIFDPGAFRHLPNTLAAGVRFDLTF